MSDLTKMTVVVKNYKDYEGEGLDRLYKRVRLEDQEGNTFYFKNVVVPPHWSSRYDEGRNGGCESPFRSGFKYSKAEVLLMDLRQTWEFTDYLFAHRNQLSRIG